MQTNDLCQIQLLRIEMFDHLTVYKQMADVLIQLLLIHSNTWNHLTLLSLLLNWSVRNRTVCLFNCVCLQCVYKLCI